MTKSNGCTEECILWDGHTFRTTGYGRVKVNGKVWLAHRYVWQETNGPIPAGLCVLHSCDNRLCINVEHLFLGTIGDNNRDMCQKGRGWQQKKTHCPRGHEYSEENTLVYRNSRYCRVCRKNRREGITVEALERERELGRIRSQRYYRNKKLKEKSHE